MGHISNQIVTKPGIIRKKKNNNVRLRLLNAALLLFSERGYEGVAVDDIVAKAGANKRMVYHYFGSKDGIYGEVLRTVYDELETIETSLFADEKTVEDPVKAMQKTVKAYFDFLNNHPAFVRLLLWENLNEGRHLADLERPPSKTPMLSHLSSILRSGEKSGVFRAGMDCRKVLVSLIGLCLVYFSNRHTLSMALGVDIAKKSFLDSAALHTAQILLRGISA